MNAKMQRTGSVLVVTAIILLLCTLIGFDVYPSLSGNDPLVVQNQTLLQITRAQFLAKDVLSLKYLPVSYHAQAISDLQTTLPDMEQVQNGLAKGDSSLGLPNNPSDDVVRALARAQSDYTPLVAAFKVILSNPDAPIDVLEINIILMHDRPYATSMYAVNIILQQEAETTAQHLLLIKISIKTAIMLLCAWYYAFVGRNIYDKLVEIEESSKNTPPPLGVKLTD